MSGTRSRSVSNLGVRTLTAFAEVLRTGSATAAARNLGTSQPGVSRMLTQLEQAVGFELFYRDRGKLVPTQDGIMLGREVEFALAGLQRVNSLAADIATSATGELRVVAPPSFAEGLLPEIVANFLKRFPGVRFSLDSRSIETASTMISTRVVDCGFMKMPVNEDGLNYEPVISCGSVCVLTADHPLAEHEVLTPELLRRQPLILLGSGRHWRVQVDQIFATYRLRPTVAIETHTHGSACALAAQGAGVAIVNQLLARSYLRPPLVARPLRPAILHEYAFVTPAQGQVGRLTTAFRDQAKLFLSSIETRDGLYGTSKHQGQS